MTSNKPELDTVQVERLARFISWIQLCSGGDWFSRPDLEERLAAQETPPGGYYMEAHNILGFLALEQTKSDLVECENDPEPGTKCRDPMCIEAKRAEAHVLAKNGTESSFVDFVMAGNRDILAAADEWLKDGTNDVNGRAHLESVCAALHTALNEIERLHALVAGIKDALKLGNWDAPNGGVAQIEKLLMEAGRG